VLLTQVIMREQEVSFGHKKPQIGGSGNLQGAGKSLMLVTQVNLRVQEVLYGHKKP